MPFTRKEHSHRSLYGRRTRRLREIVMGLHWDPQAPGKARRPADLDALCVLFDARDQVLDVVYPGRPRNTDGSVIHTGDSRNGASTWDDEQIFVFLDALPEDASKLAFVVASVTGEPFDQVQGACCHVSDRLSGFEWARTELTALHGQTAHTAAVLQRDHSGWTVATNESVPPAPFLFDLLRETVVK